MKKGIRENIIKAHYRQADLEEKIKKAYERTNQQINDYTDTESLDEFHIRGRVASRELARLAGLQKDMKILDLGCGVGGPARMLAAEFGCVVTGIELVEEYCQAGNMISQQTGLRDMVTIQQGDMTDLVFEDQSFDAVWTLHTIMNIKDKSKLFENVWRVIVPGGLFALYEICEGDYFPPHFPVPWAKDASMSYLLKTDTLRQGLMEKGFKEIHWQDVSQKAIHWFQSIAKSRAETKANAVKKVDRKSGKSVSKSSRPGISLLLGKTAAEKSKNVFRNLTENRIRTVFGVFQKPIAIK